MSGIVSNKLIQQLIVTAMCVFVGLLAVLHPLLVLVVIGLLLIAWVTVVTPISAFALLLILSPLRTLIATESSVQLPLDIGQLLFIVFAILWWLQRTIRHKRALDLPQSPVFWVVCAFTVATGLTAFVAVSSGFWLTEWLKWVTVLVMIVLVIELGQARRWELMIAILVAAGVANAIVGLYIFFGGSGADHLLINANNFRAFGTFGQPNPYGGFLGILIPLAIMAGYGYLVQIWQRWRMHGVFDHAAGLKLVLYGIATVMMLGGLVASWSRGAWLGFVVSIGVIAFCVPRKLWQRVALSGSALALVGGLWISGVVPESIQARVLSATDELFSFTDVRGVDITTANYAIVERLAHWQAALNMARDNFWFGVGLGNYEVAYAEYQLENWEFPLGHAHNYYLNILGEAGMIGFLFYGIMWSVIIWVTWRTRSHPDVLVRSLSVGLMGSWAYLSFHSLLDNLYVNNLFLHLGVMFGLLAIFYAQVADARYWRMYVSSDNNRNERQ